MNVCWILWLHTTKSLIIEIYIIDEEKAEESHTMLEQNPDNVFWL